MRGGLIIDAQVFSNAIKQGYRCSGDAFIQLQIGPRSVLTLLICQIFSLPLAGEHHSRRARDSVAAQPTIIMTLTSFRAADAI
jgi:hypothetical protein